MTTQTLSPAQQNAIGRELLLTTGIAMTKKLPSVTAAALGGQMQIQLQRMGILTGVTLHFTVALSVTAAATLSTVGPWNFVQQATYTDFAGVNRTNSHGFQLWAAQAMKHGELLGLSPSYSGNGPNAGAINTNIIHTPTAVANDNLTFSLYVPLAYDPRSDLRGSVMTQTNIGEHFITLQIANALVGNDPWASPYTAGTMTLGAAGITVDAYQHYIQPQNLSATGLPLIDLSTIYGFEGGYKNTANIAANQSTYINYPNNRSIFSGLFNYENGSAFTLNETDISQVTLLVNSNTNFRELSPRLLRESMRMAARGDLPSGTYYLGSRQQPILTQQYANVQAKFDVLAANAGVTQFLSQYEVMYPSGTTLPGIVG